jgi:hypothetical protein
MVLLWLEYGNLYLRLRKMSHTIYDANGLVSHIHRRMCEWDYTIDKSTRESWEIENIEELMVSAFFFTERNAVTVDD